MTILASNAKRLLALSLLVGLGLGASPAAAQQRPALDILANNLSSVGCR